MKSVTLVADTAAEVSIHAPWNLKRQSYVPDLRYVPAQDTALPAGYLWHVHVTIYCKH